MSLPKFRIGTRGSPLALAQTYLTRRLLAAAHDVAPERFDIIVIRTTGDAIQDRPLAEAGGKGLFTKELDAALIAGDVDFAVHSSKDLPTFLPPEIALAGFLPREDVRDALIARDGRGIADLPAGAVVGTASLRRAAQLKRRRPDLRTTLLRGNVETRLRKVESGEIDATLLALAGLKRLGLADRASALLPLDEFLPAAGQGAIGIARRAEDEATAALLAPILCADTGAALAAERAFLTLLDGSCRTPIGAHARIEAGDVVFRGEVLSVDGAKTVAAEGRGPVAGAARVGEIAARDILARLPPGGVAALA
jgi:hydroxymethylbilane synthase